MGQFSIVRNLHLASNRDYNHGAIIRINEVYKKTWEQTWGPLIFYFQLKLHSYNINNQLAKFEKKFTVGSNSVE